MSNHPLLVAGGAGTVAALVLMGLMAGGDLASPSAFLVMGLTGFLVVGTVALVVIWLLEGRNRR